MNLPSFGVASGLQSLMTNLVLFQVGSRMVLHEEKS